MPKKLRAYCQNLKLLRAEHLFYVVLSYLRSRLLEINLVKRLSTVKIIYLEDGYVKPDLIVIVELSNYFIRLFILWRWRDAC